MTHDISHDDLYVSFMLDHASGALTSELQLAADLHIRLNDTGRDTKAIWNTVGGILLEQMSDLPAASGPERRRPVGRIETTEFAEQLLENIEQLEWKAGFFGIGSVSVGRGLGKLLRLSPGRAVPEHGHNRFEATVILRGAFDDGHGVYERGEIAFSTPGMKHRPAAVGDEDCICFVGREPGRLLKWLS